MGDVARRTARARWLSLPVSLILMVGIVQIPSTAGALNCQYQNEVNSFDGYVTSTNTGRMGAQGSIVTRQGEFCDGPAVRLWNAWVAIGGAPSNLDYAQAGYVKRTDEGGFVRVFAETNAGGGPYYLLFLGQGQLAYGTTTFYQAYMDWNSGKTKMTIGPFPVLESWWNPFTEWSGTQAQWMAETFDPNTMVPGTSGAKTGFTGLEELQYLGSWTSSVPSPSGSANSNPNMWRRSGFVYCLDGHRCFDVWHV